MVENEIDTKPELPELQAAIEQHSSNDEFNNDEPFAVLIDDADIKHESADDSDNNPTNNNDDDFAEEWSTIDSDDYFPSFSWMQPNDKQSKSKSNEKKKKEKRIPDRFVCEVCGIFSNNKRQHDNHYEALHTNNTYECDICGKRYAIQTYQSSDRKRKFTN